MAIKKNRKRAWTYVLRLWEVVLPTLHQRQKGSLMPFAAHYCDRASSWCENLTPINRLRYVCTRSLRGRAFTEKVMIDTVARHQRVLQYTLGIGSLDAGGVKKLDFFGFRWTVFGSKPHAVRSWLSLLRCPMVGDPYVGGKSTPRSATGGR